MVPWLLLFALCLLGCAGAGGGSEEGLGCDTRVSGVVTAPNGVDPIPGARVYVPLAPPAPLPPEVRCEPCGPQGDRTPVLSETDSGTDGRFTLSRLPAGPVTIYIQKGRWRRKLEVQTTACRETQIARSAAHLPRSRAEGELPQMAVAVGDYDAIECVLRHVGIDASEFTSPLGGGAVHLYENEQLSQGGAPGKTPIDLLLIDPRRLRTYSLLLINCTETGGIEPLVSDVLVMRNLLDYVAQGGRLYVTDWAYNLVAQQPAWSPFLCFEDGTPCGSAGPRPLQGASRGTPVPFTGTAPDGDERVRVFRDWLSLPQFGLRGGQVPINDLDWRWALMTGTAQDMRRFPTQIWLRGRTNGADRPLSVTFDYPQPAACGRILYSSHHTRGHEVAGVTFPAYCPVDGVIPQERVLEYLLFEFAACIPVPG
jgi:hypothetical protein